MQIIYNLFVRIYYFAIRVAALYNPKARKWIEGRKGGLNDIALELDHDASYVWFHCASVGEFEQGRPVLEKFRGDNPEFKVVVTFFSPSGFEMRKNDPLADHVFYLPLDTPANAAKFIEYLQPRLAVFIKYEFWFNYISVLHSRKIPVIFISAVFRKRHMFFKWWGSWFREQLKKVTYFFVQDKESRELLYAIGIRNVVISGDTRFDRVLQISENPQSYPRVEKFIQGSVIFLAGSTWPADDSLLVDLINQDQSDLKYIIVPHEINSDYIEKLSAKFSRKVVRYSSLADDDFQEARVLIVDRMGMLSSLYQYASLAYIGGGFGKGIHNTLEAATFGMPVIFGPNYKRFAEAVELVEIGSAFAVSNRNELVQIYTSLLADYKNFKNISENAKNYVHLKKGASATIMLFINTIVNPSSYRSKALDLLNMN